MYKKPTRWTLVLGVLGVAACIALAGVWLASRQYRPAALKDRIVALLSDQLESEVTLDSLEGRVFPQIALSGGGLVVRYKGRTDVPPLLTIKHFEIRATFHGLMERPRHVSEVRLRGLEVNIPPGDDRDEGSASDSGAGAVESSLGGVVIDRFEAPDTTLTIIPRRPNKPPKVFTIHHLVIDSVGRGRTMPYIAVLTNPVPRGEIETSGKFGPWNVEQPSLTPVQGSYTFANADLNTITGLSGILSSTGKFDGPLRRIHVEGTTDTPKFQIDAGGQAVPLQTRFTATVDGSDGDTILDRIDGKLLDTELVAKGAVIGIDGAPGHRIEVEMSIPKGRVEDVLRLAMDAPTPLLRGLMQMQARLVIPPDKATVLDKLSVRGVFALSQARFADSSVQAKITNLSRHGRGLDNDEPSGDVVSQLKGHFVMEKAVVAFSELTFGVPGAAVELAGRYALRSQELDFHGHLRLQATVSQAAGGGVKSFFLKAIDPFFKKDGAGAVLPIKIVGTRKDPKFGLELFGGKK